MLKITLIQQIKEAFVWSNVNTTSILKYPFEFCYDVSFIGTIFSRNRHLLFVLSLLISDLTFVFLLLSLLVSIQPDISKIFFFVSWVKTTVHTNLENQLDNFGTWNNSILMKYTGDSAEWIIIIWAQFVGQVHGTRRLTALKLFP